MSVLFSHPTWIDLSPSAAISVFTFKISNFVSTIFTVRNKVAKVMFLHVCVCPGGGGVPGQVPPSWDQVHPLGPGTSPRDQIHPLGPGTPPVDQVHRPGTRYTPPGPGAPAADWNAFLFNNQCMQDLMKQFWYLHYQHTCKHSPPVYGKLRQ